jgi:hypothetical protein
LTSWRVSGNLRCGPLYDASTLMSSPHSSGATDMPDALAIEAAEFPLGIGFDAGWYVRSMFSTLLMVAVWFL